MALFFLLATFPESFSTFQTFDVIFTRFASYAFCSRYFIFNEDRAFPLGRNKTRYSPFNTAGKPTVNYQSLSGMIL